MTGKSIIVGQDGRARCWWCGEDPLYQQYHDTEWGRPVYDDTRLFEKICLEGFQSGLSWIIILRKRENFRAAFDGFNCDKVAKYDNLDIQRLLQDAGIIRHRGKIEATINNAQRALELISEHGSLSEYFWSFAPSPPCHPERSRGISLLADQKGDPSTTGSLPPALGMTRETIPSQTPESEALSRDLKKRGWKFVGPTTCYAFMQAMGMVNDHVKGCALHSI